MRGYLMTTFYLERAVGIVCIILLIWCCFYGYRMRRLFGIILSFIGGFCVGGWLAFKLFHNPFIGYPIAIVCGLPLAYGALRFKKFGNYMLSTVLCCLTISIYFSNLSIIQEIIVIVVAGLIGLPAIFFERVAIITTTSINCGMMIVGIFLFLVGFPAQALYIALGAIISLAGIVTQFSFRKTE